MASLVVIAQADSPANRWLSEHPLVLGLLFLAIGGALLISGVVALRSGVTHDKWGNELRGGLGQSISLLRLVAGVGLCIFAIYKIIGG